MEKWANVKTVFAGPIFSIRTGLVQLDTGEHARRDVVVHHGGVAVVPVLNNDIILVEQFRIAINQTILELPAGKLESAEDEPAARALSELEEETGLHAGRLIQAADYYSSPGYVTERLVIYLAFDLSAVPQRPEYDERISLVRLSLAEARRMLDEQLFIDGKTIIGLRELFAYMDRQDAG